VDSNWGSALQINVVILSYIIIVSDGELLVQQLCRKVQQHITHNDKFYLYLKVINILSIRKIG